MPSMEEELIKLVRANRHLYDKSDKSYKDFTKAENTWEMIRATLGLPDHGPNKAKKRWSTLRQKFSREFKKYSSGTGASKIHWQFWEAMSFLKDHMESKEAATNSGSNKTEGKWLDSQSSEEEEVMLEAHYSESDTSRLSTASTVKSNNSSGPSASKKRKTNGQARISGALHQIRPEVSTMLIEPPVEDEIDAFMRASAMALKSLSRARFLRAKRQINNIIIDLEEEELLNN